MTTNSHQTDRIDQTDQKTILVAVTDIFFYTKVRDALMSKGYKIERARTQQDIAEKALATAPSAFILNMNDERLDAFQALETLSADAGMKTIPILAFANHEEVDTFNRARMLGVTKIVSRNEFSSRLRDLVEEILAAPLTPHGSRLTDLG
ncbi:MAG TPA: histidine kinase [Nitrospiraceae bacterium]|nr:histidine kinase [Nitrospiraceae bacterium]